MAYARRSTRTRKRSYSRRTTARRTTYRARRPVSRRAGTRRRSVAKRSRPQTLRIVIQQPAVQPMQLASPASLSLLGETEKPTRKAKLGSNS